MYDINTPEGMDNAKVWMLALLSTLREGGKWAIPRSGAVYTFFHSTKTAHRAAYLTDKPTDQVLRELGWTVIDPRFH